MILSPVLIYLSVYHHTQFFLSALVIPAQLFLWKTNCNMFSGTSKKRKKLNAKITRNAKFHESLQSLKEHLYPQREDKVKSELGKWAEELRGP